MVETVERAAPDPRARLAAAAVVLLAVLPSVGTLRAPWIAEDAAILAQVRDVGPWADWGQAQYGMHLVRFWRPLVSTSWALQAATTGIDPVCLRLFNLSVHALTALLVFGCARRLASGLAGGLGGAFLAGAWIALFPWQGGDVTWLAGRTDLLCALFLAAGAFAALGPRPLRAAPLAFLACAAKEFGFLCPVWIATLALARGETLRSAARRALPALGAVGVAFVWRWVALGGLAGGYPAQFPPLGASLAGIAGATASVAWPSVLGLACLAALGAWAQSASPRALGLALVPAVLTLVPLAPLLADGSLEAENRRLFYVPECVLALAAACTVLRATSLVQRRHALSALVCVVLAARLALAWNDTHVWADSARFGEDAVARARASLEGTEPGPAPVLFADFEAGHRGANCLGFGLAARFRAPFPATPRPVWPWRLLFVPRPERVRQPLVAQRTDGSIRPLDDARSIPELALSGEDERALESIVLDQRAVFDPVGPDRSPRIAVGGGPAGAMLEGVLFTELGYEPVPLGTLDANGAAEASLMQLLLRANDIASVAAILEHAADFGAENAYLELRAVDEKGSVRAASRWVPITWMPDLRK